VQYMNNAEKKSIRIHKYRLSGICFFALVLAISGWALFSNLQQESLAPNSDEVIHTRVTQEMLHSGNWLMPTHGGRPYMNKPPLKMWATASILSIFGESNLTYRFVDGCCGLIIVAVTYFAIYQLGGSALAAAIGSLMPICSPALLLGRHGLRRATQDGALTALCEIATLLGLMLILALRNQASQKKSRTLALTIGSLTGAAVLIKSAAGFLPLAIILPFILLSKHAANFIERLKLSLLVITPAIIIPSLYYIPALLTVKYGYAVAIKQELIRRAVRGYHNKNDPWLYVNFLFGDIFDVAAALPNIVLIASLTVISIKAFKERSIVYTYLLAAFLIPVIGYSAIASRLPWYVFPALPFGAIIIGLTFAHALKWMRSSSLALKACALMFLLVSLFLGYKQASFCYYKVSNPKFKRLKMDILAQSLREKRNPFESSNKVLVPYRYVSYRSEGGKYNIEGIYLRTLRDRIISMPKNATDPLPYITAEVSHVLIRKSWVPALQKSKKSKIVSEIPGFRARGETAVLLELES
jgi:4-amino-4-deoxy-L-arabinose transferase-like glycosyltransferase